MKKFAAFVISSSLVLLLFNTASHASEFDNFNCGSYHKKQSQLPPFATLDNGVMSIGTKVIVKKVPTPNPYLSTNHSIIIPENDGIFVIDDKTPPSPPSPVKRNVLFKTFKTNQTNETNETNSILSKQTQTNKIKQTGAQP